MNGGCLAQSARIVKILWCADGCLAATGGLELGDLLEGRFPARTLNLVVGDKWGLKPLPDFINSEGYCYDSLWASHLDGVKHGLITNDEFPFQRDPESVAISEAALALATTHASNMDMSVDDFLAQVSDDSLDMTLPTRGDDE